MRPLHQRRMFFVGGFAVYFIALWVLWPTPVVYPLKIFVVFLHELSHAIAGEATGGSVGSITLSAQEGGATLVRGGIPLITLSAGYLGSLLWGLALLLAAHARPARGRLVVAALGIMTLGVTVLLVRSIFGFVFGIIFGMLLLGAARKLRAGGIQVLLMVLGLTSALYAVLDIRDDVLARPTAPSDANMLAQLTHIPTVVWGVLWIGIAVACCFLVMRRLWPGGSARR